MKSSVFLFFSFTIIYSQKLPPYIEKCKLTDKNVNVCLTDSANGLIKELAKGYEPLGIPKLNPMKLERIILSSGIGLGFVMNKVQIHGLDNFKAETFLFYLNPINSGVILSNPRITITGDYDINGNILDRSVYGTGRANISLLDGIYTWFPNMYSTRSRTGATHWKLGSVQSFTFTNKAVKYNLENLFEGDKIKGNETNEFLNTNWGLVSELLRGGYNSIFAEIFTYVVNKFTDQLPIDELFNF